MATEPARAPSAPAHRLRAEAVAVAAGAAPIDDAVREGEIVGLAGLDGHGQEAFLEILAGLRTAAAGHVVVDAGGQSVAITGFRQAVRKGIAYLARDRRANGIFPSLSILDNFAIVSVGRDAPFGLIDSRRRRARYEQYRRRLEIVAPSPDRPITALSGGNQQKVLLARWLALEPRVLLLNDPTRGVDQRTRETLYQVFRELARAEGMALVVLSTEIEEIMRLCDRVLVFRDQQVIARLAGAEMSHDRVIAAMFGRLS
jgi:ABC-type sugar transport system ATPase subunit